MSTLFQDLRFAVRMLRKSPGFSAVAVLTLALGIGANTAVFSVINAVLLRPLAFPKSSDLVRLWDTFASPGNQSPVSYPNFADWRAWNRSFSGMAAYEVDDFVLTGGAQAAHLDGVIASADLFRVLGVNPILGRSFRPEEDVPGADAGADPAIISYALWQQRFMRDPQVIGQRITLNYKPFIIVGVMPPGFRFPMDLAADLWTTVAPLAEKPANAPRPISEERQMSFLATVARLRPGVTLAQAQADMDGVAAQLMQTYPKDDGSEGVLIEPLQQAITAGQRPILLLLLGAVSLVLLIACANVGGLLLARTTGRQREIAIRSALGAGRARLIAQLLVESVLLAAIGSAIGLWLAFEATGFLKKALSVPSFAEIRVDASVLTFTLLVAIISVVVFGLAPALHAAKSDVLSGLKEGTAAAGQGMRARRWRGLLVTAEVALALILLSASGLLTRSLIKLQQVNPGFNAHHVVLFEVALLQKKYPQSSWAPFFDELVRRLETVPGVVSSSASGELPMGQRESRTVLYKVAGVQIQRLHGIAYSPVTPGYFTTLGVPLERGRLFNRSDTTGSQPVVIINEAAAREYFGMRDPIGQEIEPAMWNGSGSTTRMRTVVGVVGNVRLQSLSRPADSAVYWPMSQIPSSSALIVEVKTAGTMTGLLGAIRAIVSGMDKDLPVDQVIPLSQLVNQSLSEPRYNTVLLGLFAVLALALTLVGLYGVIAYSVMQRTHEIGLRMALGADKKEMLVTILRQGLVLTATGVAIGLPAAIAAAWLLRGLIFGIGSGDPLTFTVAATLLFVIALAASYIPALAATKIDPMVALRYE